MTSAGAHLALCLATFTACVVSAGCAGLGLSDDATMRPLLDPQASMEAIVLGHSSKDDVAASMGPATVISFDSGYEVWVYRWFAAADRSTRAAAELVVLFAPSGVAAKMRFRPGYRAQE